MTVLRWLRRRGAVVLLTTALVTVVTVLVAPTGTVSYTSQARFFVATGASKKGPGSANEAITLAQELAQVIPTTDRILRAATESSLTIQDVADRLTVTNRANSNMVVISFTDSDPTRALRAASDIANALKIGVPHVVPSGSITEVSAPAPQNLSVSRVSSTAEHAAYGLGLGLLLGLVLAVAWDRRDRRVDDAEELSRLLNATVTSLRGVTEWQARSLRQRWLPTADRDGGVIGLVSCRSYVTDPLPWLHAVFSTAAEPAGLSLVEADEAFLRDVSAVKSHSGTTLLFAGRVGTDGAIASTLVADVMVLAVTEGTPARDVMETYHMLAQQGVAPHWGVLVPRRAARAESRRSKGPVAVPFESVRREVSPASTPIATPHPGPHVRGGRRRHSGDDTTDLDELLAASDETPPPPQATAWSQKRERAMMPRNRT